MTIRDDTSPWLALSHARYRALWLASIATGIGASAHDTAAVWSVATTSESWMVTAFPALASMPLFAFALPAGALADIADKRKLVLTVHIGGAVVATAMAIQCLVSTPSPKVLLAGAFVLGTLSAFGMPAWQSLMPEVIDKPRMASAITLGSIGINAARAIGPLLGGILVGATGPTSAFFFNAATFLTMTWVLARWQRPRPPVAPHAETIASAVVAAIRHVRYSQPIHHVLIRHALFAFAAFAPIALLPIIAKRLALGASSFGLLMGAYGLGGVLAALFVLPSFRRRWSVDQITLITAFTSLASILILPHAGSMVSMALVLFIAGASWLITMAQMNFAGQSVFPHWIRARASAVQLLSFQGAIALGALLWGQITERSKPSVALGCAAAIMLVYMVTIRRYRLDSHINQDLTPVAHDHQHAHLAWEPKVDDGPVRITIRYEVREKDEPAFLRAIAALRETRLRDGAYRWHLWRDLKNPRILHEVFLVGSWQEHLRQADRSTVSTRDIEQNVLAFHCGDAAPEVHHDVHVEPDTTLIEANDLPTPMHNLPEA